MEFQKEEVKKEIQETIFSLNKKITEEEFSGILKSISPGTNFRAALDGILRAGNGALIVVQNEHLAPIIDGGFRVNCRFTPQRLIELSKMDGAIILSKDIKRINHANVLLIPDVAIKTLETGTRHKAAERTARQIGGLAVAISERKHEINLFYKDVKYNIKNTEELLRKANEYIQFLEKQRELFDINLENLTRIEVKGYYNLNQAVNVIQKGRIIQKIAHDLKKYIVELGTEGTLLKARFKELILGAEKETLLVVKDYTKLNLKKSRVLLDSLSYDEILDSINILRALAYEKFTSCQIKGWRILSKTSLSELEVANLVKETNNLYLALNLPQEEYLRLFGEEKTKIFKEEVEKINLGS